MTIFHILQFVIGLLGTFIGVALGKFAFGTGSAWLMAGAVIGFLVGMMAGQIPIVWIRKSLLRRLMTKSTDELRACLRNEKSGFHPGMVLLVLSCRGEDIQQELACVADMLISESPVRRRRAWETLKQAFPDEAKKLPAYSPSEPVNVCRTKIEPLRCTES